LSKPKFAIVRFPGSNCEQDVMDALTSLDLEADYVWHNQADLVGYDAVILPGGFSYGDYLRCGAISAFAPIMRAVREFADHGGYVMGICNGFQILTEAHLLPGALIRNRGLKFICEDVQLSVETTNCAWLDPDVSTPGSIYTVPINHNEGNYTCDETTLQELRAGGQVVLRYVGVAPNGATDRIAGICNPAGNVFGLMPPPERVCDGLNGQTDGANFFKGLLARF
jgi:phosphoribosylformylglycinamidine synthase